MESQKKNNFKELDLPFSSFIGGWFLDNHTIEGVIDYYNDKKSQGKNYGGMVFDHITGEKRIDTEVKECDEVGVEPSDIDDPRIFKYVNSLNQCIKNYEEKYFYVRNCDNYGLKYGFNIQNYPEGGGYKKWHFERGSMGNMSSRLLVFMTYLNDVQFGGTEFYFQQLQVQAQKGLTLLWPADWTHTHRGVISNTQSKMIATGWFNFLKGEENETAKI